MLHTLQNPDKQQAEMDFLKCQLVSCVLRMGVICGFVHWLVG